jgi:hypothetical protein
MCYCDLIDAFTIFRQLFGFPSFILIMSRLFIPLIFTLLTRLSFGQIAGDYLIGLQMDVVKTDNTGILEKAQFGAEVNYFVTRNFTGTTGLEIWTGNDLSFLIGARWFPNEDGFVRVRGLIGENDLSIGGGWIKPINDHFRFEAIADFYFKVDFSIRAGLTYVIRR